jgi:RNA polymerase sigma-70 factor, ECF subfamily
MLLSVRKRLEEQEEHAYSFAPKLYRLAYARLGNKEDAEDVVQETYFKAFTSFGRFKNGSNMDSWLTTILLNTIRDHIRKVSKTGNAVSLDSIVNDTELLPTQLINRKSPDTILEEKEIDSELTSALRELPEFFLLPLLLKDLQDFTYKEIAACLDIPMGTVMSRLARARDFLRLRLIGNGRAAEQLRARKNKEQTSEAGREDLL